MQPSSAEELPENGSKDLEEVLLGRVVNESVNVNFFPFCLRVHITGSEAFNTQSTGHVQEKI